MALEKPRVQLDKAKRFTRRLESGILKAFQGMIFDTLHEIQEDSPVDTSLYQSNHRVDIGAPSTDLKPLHSDAAQLAAAKVALETIKFLGPGLVVNISNPVRYAGYLEAGVVPPASPQAPAGIYNIHAGRARAKFEALLKKFAI